MTLERFLLEWIQTGEKRFTDFIQTFRDIYFTSTGAIPVCSVRFRQVVLELSIFEKFCLNGFRTEKKKVHRFRSNFQGYISRIYRGDSSFLGEFLTSSSWVIDFWTFLLEWIQNGEKKKFTDSVQTFRDVYSVSTGVISVCSVIFWQVVLEL
jgi:hypothetical protein